MLPVERTFVKQFLDSKLKDVDFDIMFEHYDKDRSGEIGEPEMREFTRDLVMKKSSKASAEEVIQQVERHLDEMMRIMDANQDGKVLKSNMEMFIKLHLT